MTAKAGKVLLAVAQRSVEESLHDGLVGVDAAVAQEGPVAARVFEQAQVDLADEDLFLVVRGLGNDAAEGIGEERSAPELEAGALPLVALQVAVLHAYAVDGGNKDSVGDGVAALDGLPGVILGLAELGLLRRVPADGGRVEEQVRALQRGDARAFGIPLVPADEGPDLAHGGVEGLEAEVAGGEVELLVVERIVGDVHLAIHAGQRSIRS